MTQPRNQQIVLEETSFFHCVVKCVRNCYLCGDDKYTGKNFDHRKQWVVTRLRQLANLFAIDVCAYAVMSNHYHAVLHVDQSRALAWSEHEVVRRWMSIFTGEDLIDRWLADSSQLNPTQLDQAAEIIAKWRGRLMSISWYMRCMNETIARQSNGEDGCKGRFWQGRFKSQALVGDAALLTCMAYVDLNPIRAALAQTPENSDFTSIQQRIFEIGQQKCRHTQRHVELSKRMERQRALLKDDQLESLPQGEVGQADLMAFTEGRGETADQTQVIPFKMEEYLQLVDSTGRIIRADKRGAIPADAAPILNRLGIDEGEWVKSVQHYGSLFSYRIGVHEMLQATAHKMKNKWVKGAKVAKKLFMGVSEGIPVGRTRPERSEQVLI